MSNIRIVSDNAANRLKSLSAINGAVNELVASMLNDIKTDVFRSSGLTETYTMKWESPEIIEAWHNPWTNWSPTCTARLYGYSDEAATALIYDSGLILPCPAPAIILRDPWTAVTSASAYKHGGGAHARHWLPKNTTLRCLKVVVNDPNNKQGYLESGRQVAGKYWEAEYNPEWGAPVSFATLSTQFRDGDTNLRTNIGGKFKKQQIAFAAMNEVDRDFMLDLLALNGIEIPFIMSIHPNSTDFILERAHMGYFQLIDESQISNPSHRKWATGLNVESV